MILCRDPVIKSGAMRLVNECTRKEEKEAFSQRSILFFPHLVSELSSLIFHSWLDDENYIAVENLLKGVKAFCKCSPELASHLVHCGLIAPLALALRDQDCDEGVARGASKCLLHIARTLPEGEWKQLTRYEDMVEGLQTSCYFSAHIHISIICYLYNRKRALFSFPSSLRETARLGQIFGYQN